MHEMAGPSPEVWFRHVQSCVLSADLIQEDQVDGVDEDRGAKCSEVLANEVERNFDPFQPTNDCHRQCHYKT